MPTEKPRVTITMSNDQFESIDNYRYAHKMKNQTQAILSLIENGLSKLEQTAPAHNKKSPSYSDEALTIASDYTSLDSHGKAAIRALMDEELNRMEELAQLTEDAPEKEPKIIPLYLTPAAAGYASPVIGEEFEPLTLGPDDPQGADFAVRLQGDSMEPAFPDGTFVFCNRDPMSDGDIGVFVVDGEAVCKQYHYDPMLGMTYLFSLNRARADADKLITRTSGQTLTCMGRVITKRRFPLPGM